MAHGVKVGWLIEGTGEDTGSVLFIRLPEQARAAFSAKSALRNLGCAVPPQAAVFDDCDIVFLALEWAPITPCNFWHILQWQFTTSRKGPET